MIVKDDACIGQGLDKDGDGERDRCERFVCLIREKDIVVVCAHQQSQFLLMICGDILLWELEAAMIPVFKEVR